MTTQPVTLVPKLGLTSVVAFGLSYMAPSLVMIIFGIIAAASAGTAPTAFIVSTIAIFLTALSYAKMARLFPTSGSAYSYARKLLNSPIGFLVGWSVLLDYLFLPMLAWLTQGIYLNAQYPQIPIWVWMLINAVLTTVINIAGVVLSDRVNKVFTTGALLLVLLFAGYCVAYLTHTHPVSYTAPLWNHDTTLIGISGAAAIAAYSFLGFDAVTTLSEETHNARKTIPRAVLLVVGIGGVLFSGVAYLMQLVHPGGVFDDPQIAGYSLSIQVGGQAFADWTNLAGIIAGFAAGLAVQLGSSRMLFIMGRDGVFPKRIFGKLNARTRTPIYCILATLLMCIVGLNLSLETASAFINFGAFSAFTVVNICVIAYFVRNRKTRPVGVIGYVIIPGLGACVTAYMLTQLSPVALMIGGCWLVAGVGYLTWITRGFRRPTPEPGLDEQLPTEPEPESEPINA
ncbi:Putrescine importer PuuP (plasmid) [Arthrobacter sp. ERGS1:01]|uniref:APC family permease n=1 Tax=Arthrobacter sp. ERGS1:01 TaxID=1704044 RepID=UPI0006B6511C|nr:APC family permease [Arthrobacter sp. ERGS1:01]ALE04748.1 Putrescine importer PuuP [Arthrobacter sp. ERGS1:01]